MWYASAVSGKIALAPCIFYTASAAACEKYPEITRGSKVRA